MSKTTCCVPGCSREGRHIFPRDISPQQIWVHAMKRKIKYCWSLNTSSYICENHFKPDDYKSLCRKYHGTERINKTAVPRAVACTFSETALKAHVPKTRNDARESQRRRLFQDNTSAVYDDAEMTSQQIAENNDLSCRSNLKEFETPIQKRCSWGTCRNYTKKRWVPRTDMYLPFPSILNDYQKCVRWISLCGGPNPRLNVDNITKLYGKEQFYVCSEHFKGNTPTSINPDPEQAPAYVQPPLKPSLKRTLKPPLKRKAKNVETSMPQFQNESKKLKRLASILPKPLDSNEQDDLLKFLRNVSETQMEIYSNKESQPSVFEKCKSQGPVKGTSKIQTEQRFPHNNIKVISRGLLNTRGPKIYHKDHSYCRRTSNSDGGNTLVVEVQIGESDDSSNEECKQVNKCKDGTKQNDHLDKSKKEQNDYSHKKKKEKNGVLLDINDENAGQNYNGEMSSWDCIVRLVRDEMMETKNSDGAVVKLVRDEMIETKNSDGDDKLEVDMHLVKQESVTENNADIFKVYAADAHPGNADVEVHDSHIDKTDLDKCSEIDKQHESAIDKSEGGVSLVKNEVWEYTDEFGVCTSVRIDDNFLQKQGTCTHENVEGMPLHNQDDSQTVSTDITKTTKDMAGVPEHFIKTESEMSDKIHRDMTVLQEYYKATECSSGSTNQISEHENTYCKGSSAPSQIQRISMEILNAKSLTKLVSNENATHGNPDREAVDSSRPINEKQTSIQGVHTKTSPSNVEQGYNPQQNTNTVGENNLKVNPGRHFFLVKGRHSHSTNKSESKTNSKCVIYPLNADNSAINLNEYQSSINQLTNHDHSNLLKKGGNTFMSTESISAVGSSDPPINITTCKGPFSEFCAKGILEIDRLVPKERTTPSDRDGLDYYRRVNVKQTSLQCVKTKTPPTAISMGQGYNLQQHTNTVGENDFKVKAGRYILMIKEEHVDSTTKNDKSITYPLQIDSTFTPKEYQSSTNQLPIPDLTYLLDKGTNGPLSEFCVKGILKIDPLVGDDILVQIERFSKQLVNNKNKANSFVDKNKVNNLKQDAIPVSTACPSEQSTSSPQRRSLLKDWDIVDEEITAHIPGQTAKNRNVKLLVKKGVRPILSYPK